MSYKFQQGAYDIEKRMKRRSLLINVLGLLYKQEFTTFLVHTPHLLLL